MRQAMYFKDVKPENLRSALVVHPPYEPKTSGSLPPPQWVKGYMKLGATDFVITGPKMRVVYSGCRWNKIVFALNGAADEEVYMFEKWLHEVNSVFEQIVRNAPDRYKPGAKSSTRFLFDGDYVKPSSDPALYPDELRCRLSTQREAGGEDGVSVDVINTHFIYDNNGTIDTIGAENIKQGMEIMPIVKISYYRNIERFGLNLTILKGWVYKGEEVQERPSNMDWEFGHDI